MTATVTSTFDVWDSTQVQRSPLRYLTNGAAMLQTRQGELVALLAAAHVGRHPWLGTSAKSTRTKDGLAGWPVQSYDAPHAIIAADDARGIASAARRGLPLIRAMNVTRPFEIPAMCAGGPWGVRTALDPYDDVLIAPGAVTGWLHDDRVVDALCSFLERGSVRVMHGRAGGTFGA